MFWALSLAMAVSAGGVALQFAAELGDRTLQQPFEVVICEGRSTLPETRRVFQSARHAVARAGGRQPRADLIDHRVDLGGGSAAAARDVMGQVVRADQEASMPGTATIESIAATATRLSICGITSLLAASLPQA